MIEPMSRDKEIGHQPLTGPRGTKVADAIARRVRCRAYWTDPVPEAGFPLDA